MYICSYKVTSTVCRIKVIELLPGITGIIVDTLFQVKVIFFKKFIQRLYNCTQMMKKNHTAQQLQVTDDTDDIHRVVVTTNLSRTTQQTIPT